jgi:hypothetical protein
MVIHNDTWLTKHRINIDSMSQTDMFSTQSGHYRRLRKIAKSDY